MPLLRLGHEEDKMTTEPVAWISDSPTKGNGKQLHWTKAQALKWSSNIMPLYAAPLKPDLLNQTCCECGCSGGYALYCVDCWSKAETRYTEVGQVVQAFGDLVVIEMPEMPPVGTKLYVVADDMIRKRD